MTLSRRPAPDPRRPAKPGTARAGAPGTGRSAPPRAPAPAKNNTPIILGCAGGGVLLLIILFVAFSGGDEPKAKAAAKSKAPKEDEPKRAGADVSGLEAAGKQKCEEGLKIVESRVTPDPSVPKEQFLADLEKGLLLLKDGLASYKKASELAGKKYDTGRYTRAQNVALTLFCGEHEKAGVSTCDQGLALIKSTASLLTGKELSDEEKKKLKDDLSKGKSLISAGMEHFSAVERVSGRTFDQSAYQEALLIARKKLPELQ